MADWVGVARSNYFAVNDERSFLEWAKKRNLRVMKRPAQGRRFADNSRAFTQFAVESEDEGGPWPSFEEDQNLLEDGGMPREIDIQTELAQHLKEGEIAVLMEVGAEGAKYLSGTAYAVDHRGTVIRISLRDIYSRAAEVFGVSADQISECSY